MSVCRRFGAEIRQLIDSGGYTPPRPLRVRPLRHENLLSPQVFWRTIVAASVVARQHGLGPLQITTCKAAYNALYPGHTGHSGWLRLGQNAWSMVDVWSAAGVVVTPEMDELISVHLIPWWIAHIDEVHQALTDWIQTLGSAFRSGLGMGGLGSAPADPGHAGLGFGGELPDDALLDQALEAVRARRQSFGWPNHGETDRRCLAAVANPVRLVTTVRQFLSGKMNAIDWTADKAAANAVSPAAKQHAGYNAGLSPGYQTEG